MGKTDQCGNQIAMENSYPNKFYHDKLIEKTQGLRFRIEQIRKPLTAESGFL